MKYFVYTVIAVVILAVIGGIIVAGSPAEERARRFDQERVWNLQYIQSEVANYWVNKETLPKNLEELQDPLRGFILPKDPQTGEEYGYEIKGELSFSLCANFQTESEYSDIYSRNEIIYPAALTKVENNWEHGIGKTCFEREIDPDFFKKD